MGDFPETLKQPAPIIIDTMNSLGQDAAIGYVVNPWPAANRAYLIPFVLDEQIVARLMGTYMSPSTFAGNNDMGIYDRAGNLLVSVGSAANVAGFNVRDIADTVLQPGYYFMAMALDNNTAQVHSASLYSTVEVLRTMGVCTMDSAFPLPSTVTFSIPPTVYLPAVAVYQNTWT